MNKETTIEMIRDLLAQWSNDPESVSPDLAWQVFDQMPITLAESSNGPWPEFSFEDLVRSASHDLFRATVQ